METKTKGNEAKATKPLFLRKITRSGSTKYLSITRIIPKEWAHVKVVVEEQSSKDILLRITPIE